jgi:hypothetical protein
MTLKRRFQAPKLNFDKEDEPGKVLGRPWLLLHTLLFLGSTATSLTVPVCRAGVAHSRIPVVTVAVVGTIAWTLLQVLHRILHWTLALPLIPMIVLYIVGLVFDNIAGHALLAAAPVLGIILPTGAWLVCLNDCPYNVMRIANFMGGLFPIAIFAGSFMFFLDAAVSDCHEKPLADNDSLINPATTVDALYFGMVSLTTVGFGDITPKTFAGRLFTSFLMLFIVTIFPLLTATLVGVLTNKSPFRKLQDLLQQLGLEFEEVHKHVNQWLPLHQSTNSFGDLMAVVASFPDLEKREKLNSNYTVQAMQRSQKLMDFRLRCFRRSHFFALEGRIHSVDHEPGALLVEHGERTFSMFFLISGTVIATDRVGGHTPFQDLSFFNYEGLLGRMSDLSIRCLTHCRIAEVHQHQIVDLGHPEDVAKCIFWRIWRVIQTTCGQAPHSYAGCMTPLMQKPLVDQENPFKVVTSEPTEDGGPIPSNEGKEVHTRTRGSTSFDRPPETSSDSDDSGSTVESEGSVVKICKDPAAHRFYDEVRLFRVMVVIMGIPNDIARQYLERTCAVRNPYLMSEWMEEHGDAPLPLRWAVEDDYGAAGCVMIAQLAALPAFINARARKAEPLMRFLGRVEKRHGRDVRDFMDRVAAFGRLINSKRWWLPSLQVVPREVPSLGEEKVIRWLWQPTEQAHPPSQLHRQTTPGDRVNPKIWPPRPNSPMSTLTYEQYVLFQLGVATSLDMSSVFKLAEDKFTFMRRRFSVGFDSQAWLEWQHGDPPPADIRRQSVDVPPVNRHYTDHVFLPHLGLEFDGELRHVARQPADLRNGLGALAWDAARRREPHAPNAHGG